MKKGWVRFNRLMLRFSMVGGFIISIILAYVSYVLISKNNSDLGFLPFVVFLVGVIIVLAIHALWGLAIDAADNIASMPEEVAKEVRKVSGQNGQAFNKISNKLANAQNVYAQDDNEEYIDDTEVINQGGWICTNCGNANSHDCVFCQGCGMKKNTDLPS